VTKVLANTDYGAAAKKRGKQEKLAVFLRRASYRRQDVVIVGDSPEEVEIGRALGIWTVAVTGGYYSAARLSECAPDALVGRLGQIKVVLQHLWYGKAASGAGTGGR
jgi:phosphoglycolate phosphatase